MSKHTPGSWIATFSARKENPSDEDKFFSVCGTAPEIAGFCSARQIEIAQIKKIQGGTDAANARLIAAAPELLDALEKVTIAAENIGGEHVTGLRQLNDQLEVAYAAIAKATGGKE